ncbi:ABC-type nitrate/sulfonate/bicarbonate transport system, substrate-binding protein [Streptomyces sp. yr375]|uniref:ABC transporter substrate-binding protein n=2 Tax=unclassified Streptomyces TaxID=2593676 RepID=UPI0008D80C80|nr:ABC transporter substrate-binding protein [Streptomyces sp. yr375]SEQ00958.1 ABC-type nitrate/sulfonate/bicarbonate transport system, substrate-binding protein [Streptomyces sp. yr375]
MRHTPRLIALGLSTMLAVLSLGACSSSSSGSGDGNETVTVAGDGYTLGGEAYIGKAKGYFSQEKLTPKVQTFATGLDGIKAMIAGQVQFSFGLDFAAVSTATKNVAILGTVGAPSAAGGYNQMFFSKGITSPGQLAGKKIGVLAGTAQEYVTDKWIEKNGLAGKVRTVELPGLFELVGALKSAQVNAAFVYADGATSAQQDKNLFRYGDDAGLLKVQGIYLLTLRKTVTEHPELVEKMLRALKKTTDFMAADPDQSGEILAKAVKGGDAKSLAAQIKLDNPALNQTDAQTAALLQIETFLKSSGKITDDVDVKAGMDLGPLHNVLGSKK